MWAALAVSAALAAAPADAGPIQIKNDHFTYGIYGPPRKDAEVTPGDVLILAYDIEGLTVRDDGQVLYSTAMELLNKDGKSEFKENPIDRQAVNALGGSRVPGLSRITIGADTAPGEYTVRITVADKAPNVKSQPAVVERKFTVAKPGFGIILPQFGYDKPATAPPPAPPVAVPGQTLLFFFAVVGFDAKAGKTGQDMFTTDLSVELSVLDESGKPTLAKPFTGSVKAVPADGKDFWPAQFPLSLNRSGKFTVVLTAKDNQGNKTAKLELPLTVVDVK
jgi:hypothetical protein